MTTITPTRLPGARAALTRRLDAWNSRLAARAPALSAGALFAAALIATATMIALAPAPPLA